MVIKVNKVGRDLLRDPLLNKSTAFTDAEIHQFHLHGLVPHTRETLDEQVIRCKDAYSAKKTPLEKHIYLRALQDTNELLFYRFILDNLYETLPIIYTPVVGDACQLFSHIYRQPRGLFLSYPERESMSQAIEWVAQHRAISVIVVTDGERILGLGDQGVGGMGIPIGKLSLYTACGGIHPEQTLPIILDVGTNNRKCLIDSEYIGWRHERISGKEYDDFLDQFVQSVTHYLPHVLLQFEDFAQNHAYSLLERYKDKLCCFNDDIQGTAAVVVAALIAATKVAKTPLEDQRIALLGAGSAGCGISKQIVRVMMRLGLTEEEARARFYLVDRNGLLHNGMSTVLPFQKEFIRDEEELKHWHVDNPNHISLLDVIMNAKPTILLGVSGQPKQFTEQIIKMMSSYCQKPIIFPLSNPTSRAEATPADVLKWSGGTALITTGSPFDPVLINGAPLSIAQCNNAYIFPGVGLGVVAGGIKRVTDEMMMAAAIALSDLAPAVQCGEGSLLPEITTIREVSMSIAKAVIKEAMKQEDVSQLTEEQLDKAIKDIMWHPKYHDYI
jgi:malate dehydrogenase (oxaloacetate-decarboxylating)